MFDDDDYDVGNCYAKSISSTHITKQTNYIQWAHLAHICTTTTTKKANINRLTGIHFHCPWLFVQLPLQRYLEGDSSIIHRLRWHRGNLLVWISILSSRCGILLNRKLFFKQLRLSCAVCFVGGNFLSFSKVFFKCFTNCFVN